MTDYKDLIDRANAALNGVTPGPWKRREPYFNEDVTGIVPRKIRGKSKPDIGNWAELATVENDYTDSKRFANAKFIAASRQLVPDLTAALSEAIARAEKAEAALAAETERAEAQAELVKCACGYDKAADLCEFHRKHLRNLPEVRALAEAQEAFTAADLKRAYDLAQKRIVKMLRQRATIYDASNPDYKIARLELIFQAYLINILAIPDNLAEKVRK